MTVKPLTLRLPTSPPEAEAAEVLMSRQRPTINTNTTLNGGSLGSWVDEDRSKLRVGM